MSEFGPAYENMREAIGIMTAWSTEGDEFFPARYYNSLVDEHGIEKVPDIVAGMINLCGHLLTLRAKERGVLERETLQEIAQRIADK